MSCPKCGLEAAEDAAECARCGLVFARYREQEARIRAVRIAPAGAPADAPRRLPVAGILVALGAAAALGWVVRDPPATPAARASPSAAARASARPQRDAATLAARAAAATEDGGSCPLLSGATAPARAAVGGAWLDTADYEYAVRQQRETGAPLLLYFRTDWCGYCRRLERGLLADAAVESQLADAVVRCRVNPEESPEARSVSDAFGVTGYPSLFLVADGARPVPVSTYGRGSGFPELSPEAFLDGLREDARRLARDLVVGADRLRGAGDVPAALELLDRAVAIAGDDFEVLLRRGAARAAAGDSSGAFADFAAASELEPERVDVYREAERALAAEGRWSDAAACWSLYLVDAPQNGEARQRRDRLRDRAASG